MNLQLTLSEEYGVNDNLVVQILSAFFNKIILDESVTPEIADEIFTITIVETLDKRDKRMMANAIFQICKQNMINENWSSALSESKLHKIKMQLSRYVQEYSPISLDTSIIHKI